MTAPTLSGYTLAVSDLDATSAWYRRQFALTAVGDFALEPYDLRGVALAAPNGWSIELLQRAGASAADAVAHPLDTALRTGYGFVQLDVDDLEATVAAVVADGGAALMPPHPGPGGLAAFVADPEGNVLRLRDPAAPVPPPGPQAD